MLTYQNARQNGYTINIAFEDRWGYCFGLYNPQNKFVVWEDGKLDIDVPSFMIEQFRDFYLSLEAEQEKNTPKAVQQVAKAWKENAIKAAKCEISGERETGSEAESTMRFWLDRLCVSEDCSDRGSRWVISDNYDQAPALVYYPKLEEWYYMPPYGNESLMQGGTGEALAIATIFWTP